MLELTQGEREGISEAIALRLLELDGFELAEGHSDNWRQHPRYKAAAYKAGQILDVVIEFSSEKEGRQ
jgi:hypothetical protein